MICDICSKRQAAILIQQVRNSEKKEMYICKHCADLYELYTDETSMNLSIETVLEKINIYRQQNKDNPTAPHDSTVQCPSCGTSLLEIRKAHQIGCPLCFFYFQDTILSIMQERIIDVYYRGKVPPVLETYTDCRMSVEELKTALQQAVADERYELAAYFRDKINEMEAPTE